MLIPFKSRLSIIILIQITDTLHRSIQTRRNAPVYKLSARITSLVTKLQTQTSTWTSLNYVLVPRIQNITVEEKESINCLIFITTSYRIIVQMNCINIWKCSHLFQNASDIKLGKYRLEVNIWYHSSWTSWPLTIRKIGPPETSVRSYHSTLRKIPTQCRSRLHLGGSLKSRIRCSSFQFLWTITFKKRVRKDIIELN